MIEATRYKNGNIHVKGTPDEALRMYRHDNGIISIGDTVKVVKGRTIEHGFIGKVTNIRPYTDKYGRWLADYVYFDGGRKININNCVLEG